MGKQHGHDHGHEHDHGHDHGHEHDGCCEPLPLTSDSCCRAGSCQPEPPQASSCCDTGSCGGDLLQIESDDHHHAHGHDGCCAAEPAQEEHVHESSLLPGEARSVFQVDGMDCGECARTVERVIGKLDGVREVQVRFSSTKMIVTHTAEIAELMKAVDQVGYRPTLLETTLEGAGVQAGQQSLWKRHRRTLLTAVSGALWGLGMILEFGGWSEQTAILLFLLSMLTGGYYAARAGFYALKSFTLDMNFLMTAAAIGAAAIGEWSEGATVVFLFAVGNWLQAMTMERTRRSIRSLMDLTPREALVRRGGKEVKLQLTDVRIDDVVIVRPGERLPMDGIVVSGRSTVNQAPVTGESIPVSKAAGDDVYAGTLNETGSLEFRVTKRVEDSTISRIIHLVEEAQAQKAPSQQFVDRFATIYTPAVVLLAVLVAILPPLLGFGTYDVWIYRALSLLVIACPCALVISTPVSIVAAIGNGAKRGVLIKGGAFLELMGTIQAIAFDKTGTLTEGKPQVVKIETFAGEITAEGLLAVAAAIESRSEHPLARAITEAYEKSGQQVGQADEFQAVVGYGAQATINGITYRIGKPAWFDEMGYNKNQMLSIIHEQQEQGHTVMLLADSQQVLGLIAVADVVRTEAQATVRELKQSGIIHTVMLTGDHERTAKSISKQVDVDSYQGELLPEQKLARIAELQRSFGRVAMVGDGINDAPALALADIGIAMGGAGTDTALETADIVLMSDDLSKLPFTVRLSRHTLRIIKQNIWFSLLVKAVFLALTVAGLSTLWMAVFADTGAALIVIANGMRLMKSK